jgi:tetratricopeptide (TPR) repeat protein
LAEIEATQNAGRLERALAEVEPMVEQAAALGYLPLVAEVKLRRGTVRDENGRYDAAAQDLRQAYLLRDQGADHPQLAFALVGLAENALARQDIEAARVHAERAVAIRTTNTVARELLAEAHFVLARALWPDLAARSRSHTFAVQAREAFAQQGSGSQELLAEVQAWLDEHRVP